jgi:hypothetical protein
MELHKVKAYLKDRGFDDHGRFRGRSGDCLILASKRGNWDYEDKNCRDFVGIKMNDAEADWIRFRFSISRTALARKTVRDLTNDPEEFLLQAGLLKFKRFLLENDSAGQSCEFMLHSGSAESEFVMYDPKDLRSEVSRVKYQVLDLLWQNRHRGIKRTPKEDVEDALCTTSSVPDAVIDSFEKRKFITGAYGSSGMKITAEGEVELERLQPLFTENAAGSGMEKRALVIEYDVFISHASEDKDGFVTPLAKALKEKGVNVWYDEFTLKLGDSLRESIDRGLSNSRYGLVVLSHHFFSKDWPKRELNALFATMKAGERRILPIWHELTAQEVQEYSPLLSDLLAAKSSDGVENIVNMVIEVCLDSD